MQVAFFWPAADLEAARALDPDREWRKFHIGETCWILQTYLRLVAAGRPAELTPTIPEQGLLVYHPRHRRDLERAGDARRTGVFLVTIRAERTRPLLGHFEILQNGWGNDDRRRFFVPLWPQPGLEPRDAARGSRLSCLVYKGFLENLDSGFLADSWSGFLAEHGIEWVVDASYWRDLRTREADTHWHDYRSTDAVLAVRPRSLNAPLKPASKLLNAWRAGVPALLGPEYAFRELRRSPLDYLEVDSVAAARRAVLRLHADPELYRAMVEQGSRRARAYSVEHVLGRWVRLLYEVLPERAATLGRRRPRRARLLPLPWLGRRRGADVEGPTDLQPAASPARTSHSARTPRTKTPA